MNFLSRLLHRLGYVRLRDYGYTLTSEGRIVELPRVTDDRFAPPPWEPIAWQGPTALPPSLSPPVPRALPPPPDASEMLDAQARDLTPETPVPGSSHIEEATSVAPGQDTQVRSEPEDEEWEWRMALARARERASRDTGERAVPPAIPAGASQRARRTTQPHIATDGVPRPGTQIGPGPTRAPASGHAPAEPARVSAPQGAPIVAQPSGDSSRIESGRVAHGTQGLPVAEPVETSGRIAHGTQGVAVQGAGLSATTEAHLVQAAEGTEFADGSDSHGVRAEPDDHTALDVRAAPPAADDPDLVDEAPDATVAADDATIEATVDTKVQPRPRAETWVPKPLAAKATKVHTAPPQPVLGASATRPAAPQPVLGASATRPAAPQPVLGANATRPHAAPPQAVFGAPTVGAPIAPTAHAVSRAPTVPPPAPTPVVSGSTTVPHAAPPAPAAPTGDAPLPRLTARLRRPTSIR